MVNRAKPHSSSNDKVGVGPRYSPHSSRAGLNLCNTRSAGAVCKRMLHITTLPHTVVLALQNMIRMSFIKHFNNRNSVRYSAAHFRVCADGGADRLFHHVASFGEDGDGSVGDLQRQYRPDVIIGDLDSLSDHVQKFYEGMGVEVVDLRTDEDTTDLDKCLKHVKQKLPEHESHSSDLVVVVGAIGGRLDHTLSNLNSLYTHQGMPIVLVGDGNLVRLLPQGTSKILVNEDAEGQHCGVVPLNGPVTVTTSGLRWDMDELELKFSGMISTSNQIAGSDITITCSAPCLWMTTLAHS
eukprot:jgi/Ulvmu1/2936/UM149_0015.1